MSMKWEVRWRPKKRGEVIRKNPWRGDDWNRVMCPTEKMAEKFAARLKTDYSLEVEMGKIGSPIGSLPIGI